MSYIGELRSTLLVLEATRDELDCILKCYTLPDKEHIYLLLESVELVINLFNDKLRRECKRQREITEKLERDGKR